MSRPSNIIKSFNVREKKRSKIKIKVFSDARFGESFEQNGANSFWTAKGAFGPRTHIGSVGSYKSGTNTCPFTRYDSPTILLQFC